MDTNIQENHSSVTPIVNQSTHVLIPRDSIKDLLALTLSISMLYWVVYLFLNSMLRVSHEYSGASILPDESNPWFFILAVIGNFLSIPYVVLVRKWISSRRKVLANISVFGPLYLICILLVYTLFFYSCNGDLCGLGIGLAFITLLMFIVGGYISLACAAISIFFVRKYKYGLAAIVVLFTLLLLVPTIYTLLSIR